MAKSTLATVAAITSRVSALSAVVFVAGMAPVVAFTGPYLAMGALIYTGVTTEPEVVHLPFPWVKVTLLVGAAGLALWRDRKTETGALALVSLGLAALALGLEAWHLVDLAHAATPPPEAGQP